MGARIPRNQEWHEPVADHLRGTHEPPCQAGSIWSLSLHALHRAQVHAGMERPCSVCLDIRVLDCPGQEAWLIESIEAIGQRSQWRRLSRVGSDDLEVRSIVQNCARIVSSIPRCLPPSAGRTPSTTSLRVTHQVPAA
jgi:hypothetical protein